jgi:hypothetical protein
MLALLMANRDQPAAAPARAASAKTAEAFDKIDRMERTLSRMEKRLNDLGKKSGN